jgi:hypothetical protein
MMMVIIKLNDPFRDHCIFRGSRLKNKISENSAETKTTVGIFTMMMNMKTVKPREDLYRPTLMQDPVTKERI